MIFDILLTLFLVLLNGFFVAAEFAIVKVRSSQVEIRAAGGNPIASMAQAMLKRLDAYLSATQLGITLASLWLGWIGESVVSKLVIGAMHRMGMVIADATAHSIAIGISFALITVMHIVFGELAPKSIAIRHPQRTTMFVALPMRIFYVIFRPFIWLLNGFANAVLRMVGIKASHGEESHSEEEIRLLIGQSLESGQIRRTEHELIENVFRFDERYTRQIMVPRNRISAIRLDAPREEAIQLAMEENYSRIPAYTESLDQVEGILHIKDLLKWALQEDTRPLNELLRPAYFIPESKKLADLLHDFQREHIQMAVVLDEYGITSGLVTMEDILEEIVGEIQDEHDEEQPPTEDLGEGRWRIEASLEVEDANRVLPLELPLSPNYDTLGGLIIFAFGRIPDEGEEVEYGGYCFKIIEKTSNTIHVVEAQLMEGNIRA